MTNDMTADPTAIAALGAAYRAAASGLRSVDAVSAMDAVASGLNGSASAAACADAAGRMRRALGTVADRIESMAATTAGAATSFDETDRVAAAAISAVPR